MNTKLIYMEHMDQLECLSTIIDITKNEHGANVLILDQTVFYPQGGGQPYDTGIIQAPDKSFVFNVTEVRFINGLVHHIGNTEKGIPFVGTNVNCVVNGERRNINTRLHSAGHLIDMGLKALTIDWIPGKGYHFPEGAYVEYSGSIDKYDIEKIRIDLENTCSTLIAQSIKTSIVFDKSKHESGKPNRTVFYGDFGIPCGGTHVNNLAQIGKIIIRKIKKSKESIRISYDIEPQPTD